MERKRVPKPGLKILSWCCSIDHLEMVQGDLEELYNERIQKGRLYALVLYYFDCFQLVFQFITKGNSHYTINNIAMFRNHLVFALRSMKKHSSYSVINLIGLTIGIACVIFIAQFLVFESSYDKSFEQSENIVRVNSEWHQNGQFLEHRAATVPGMHQILKGGYPEILTYARYHKGSTNVVRYRDQNAFESKFEEKEVYYADPDFFNVFDLEFTAGQPFQDEPNQMVISKRIARKYFGDENAMGKVLSFDGEFSFSAQVVGVFDGFPSNSHLKGDFILSLKTKESLVAFNIPDNWIWRSFYTYLVLTPDADVERLEEQINQYVAENKKEYYARGGYEVFFHIQPLESIHLHSNLFEEIKQNGNYRTLQILSLAGIFIVLIVFFNYVNLTTAKNMNRYREIAIRKVAGARQAQLITQYLTESFLFVFLASILAVALVYLIFPLAKNTFDLSFDFYFVGLPVFWLCLILLSLFGGILAGIYPAFVLSSSKLISLLKGKMTKGAASRRFREYLVSFQLMLSLGLTLCVVVILTQTKHMQKRDLGIRKDQVLVVNGPKIKGENYYETLDYFKQELSNHQSIKSAATVSSLPGEVTGAGRDFIDEKGDRKFLKIIRVDYGFEEVFGLQLVAGRAFAKNYTSGNDQLVINEAAVKLLGFNSAEDALASGGFTWRNVGDPAKSRILGVLKDYYPDAQSSAVPTAFVLNRTFSAPWDPEFYVFHLDGSNYAEAKESITAIEEAWQNTFPADPFNYDFVDEFYNRQFKSEQQLSAIVKSFGLAAIILACVGLLALVSFTNISKLKEIGIRKVLGSSESQVLLRLLRQNMTPIFIALVISIPVFAWLMDLWLDGYTYRIALDVWIIAVPTILFILVIASVVTLQTRKAVKVNPVDILKDE